MMARRRRNHVSEERVPRTRKGTIGYIYALNNELEREFTESPESLNRRTTAQLKREAKRLAHWLRDTPGGERAVSRAYRNADRAYEQLQSMSGGALSTRRRRNTDAEILVTYARPRARFAESAENRPMRARIDDEWWGKRRRRNSGHYGFTAEKTQSKYWREREAGLYWTVYVRDAWGRKRVALFGTEHDARNVAHLLNKQIGASPEPRPPRENKRRRKNRRAGRRR